MEINTTVTNLNLSSNRLGLSSCKYLGEMLRQNRCLKNLDLSCNHLEEGGARIIHHEGIKNNTKIRKVHWISESRKPEMACYKTICNNCTYFPLLVLFFVMGFLMTSFLPSTGRFLKCLLPKPGLGLDKCAWKRDILFGMVHLVTFFHY